MSNTYSSYQNQFKIAEDLKYMLQGGSNQNFIAGASNEYIAKLSDNTNEYIVKFYKQRSGKFIVKSINNEELYGTKPQYKEVEEGCRQEVAKRIQRIGYAEKQQLERKNQQLEREIQELKAKLEKIKEIC